MQGKRRKIPLWARVEHSGARHDDASKKENQTPDVAEMYVLIDTRFRVLKVLKVLLFLSLMLKVLKVLKVLLFFCLSDA